MNIFIAGKNISGRTEYLTKHVSDIFKINVDKILLRSFECLGIYKPESWVKTDISIGSGINKNWNQMSETKNKMMTMTCSINGGSYFQISGFGKRRANEVYMCSQNSDWSELISNFFPNIKAYMAC